MIDWYLDQIPSWHKVGLIQYEIRQTLPLRGTCTWDVYWGRHRTNNTFAALESTSDVRWYAAAGDLVIARQIMDEGSA
jgi:hypothetical protein